jgi:TRAP-type mannitol/chloroaromatic compound transport system substrate-binding protein
MLHVFIGQEKWNSPPKAYQAIVRASANRANE